MTHRKPWLFIVKEGCHGLGRLNYAYIYMPNKDIVFIIKEQTYNFTRSREYCRA